MPGRIYLIGVHGVLQIGLWINVHCVDFCHKAKIILTADLTGILRQHFNKLIVEVGLRISTA